MFFSKGKRVVMVEDDDDGKIDLTCDGNAFDWLWAGRIGIYTVDKCWWIVK